METLYFLGIALGGGFMALFAFTGWSSFRHKKIPEKGMLFRCFVAGLVTAGLLAYAWIFGSGGDVGDMVNRIGGALDLENVMKLTATLGTVAAATSETVTGAKEDATDLKIGMPNF